MAHVALDLLEKIDEAYPKPASLAKNKRFALWPPSSARPLRKRTPPTGLNVFPTPAVLWKGMANVAPPQELAGLSLTFLTSCEMLGAQQWSFNVIFFNFRSLSDSLLFQEMALGYAL